MTRPVQHVRETLRGAFEDKPIVPIFAADVGSRSQGVANEDSDYDPSIVFVQDGWRYAAGGNYCSQSIDDEVDNVDINGWNIDKFCTLLSSSNPTAIETLLSRVVYLNDSYPDHIQTLRREIMASANLKRLYHHYRSKAENNYHKYIDDTAHKSTYDRAYVIARALASTKYIREVEEVPPLNPWHFTDAFLDRDSALSEVLRKSAERKRFNLGDKKIADKTRESLDKAYDNTARLVPPPQADEIRTTEPSTELLTNFIRDAISDQ